ncbi:hypothetical protein LJ707_00575 [Mucilaginibacter sp. UR6-1]|uniref:hypothetical protein n=1 Tax=Mucilaginibacter sp. UR6-1 TaxID=1435643 RepID=UPI001E5AB1C5|nr:hypothetical protein [Mucilaginibacter sp. UR6-1]MCC8407406.1 hypothetical protein [Mucilaginibacter sp. UR6-1]
MRIRTTHKEFIFLNDKSVLTPSLKQVLAYVEECTGASLIENYEVFFKVKSIATELLTNSFKHSHAHTVNLVVDIDSDKLIIQKYDSGPPVKFGKPGLCNGKKQISYDIMCRLFANYHDEYNVSFAIEECTDDELPDIENLTEHFGLLIITKCADDFIYHYDDENKLNLFTAKINLPAN